MSLAFGFGNVWMLGWLAAAAAPILIHLWNRRHYRRVPWAATQFLLAALQTQARRLRIEQWLLLALRVAAIALAMLAAAGPYATPPRRSAVAAEPVHRIFVLDRSFSMAYRPAAETLFDRAKRRIADLVESGPAGDGLSLVLMGGPVEIVVGTPTFEPRLLLGELERVTVGDGLARLDETFAALEGLIARAARAEPRLARREVYLISDLTRPTWQPLEGPAGASLARRIDALRQHADLIVVSVGDPAAGNLAVTDLRPLDPLITTGDEAEFDVELRHFGPDAPATVDVTALADGRTVASGQARLSPDGRGHWSFRHRFAGLGERVVEVRTSGDRLAPDDRRWTIAHVRDQVRVLCVAGGSRGDRRQVESLLVALDPSGDERGLISARAIDESQWSGEPLESYACVFFCNVQQFTPEEAQRLAAYLAQGGSVVFVLGDRVRAELYNDLLLGGAGRPRLLPMRIGEPAAAGDYRLDPVGYEHPAIAAFRGQERSGLLTALVTRYVRLEPLPDAAARVALRFSSGDPALVSEALHGGQVFAFAAPATAAVVDPQSGLPWSTLPASPAFVPLVQELLRAALVRNGHSDATVGQVLSGRGAGGAAVRDPNGTTHQVRAASGASPAWSLAAEIAGIYQVFPQGRDEASAKYAVNVDPGESDLMPVPSDGIPPGLVLLEELDRSVVNPGSPGATQRPLERAFLLVSLGLLVVEGCYAWSLGRRR